MSGLNYDYDFRIYDKRPGEKQSDDASRIKDVILERKSHIPAWPTINFPKGRSPIFLKKPASPDLTVYRVFTREELFQIIEAKDENNPGQNKWTVSASLPFPHKRAELSNDFPIRIILAEHLVTSDIEFTARPQKLNRDLERHHGIVGNREQINHHAVLDTRIRICSFDFDKRFREQVLVLSITLLDVLNAGRGSQCRGIRDHDPTTPNGHRDIERTSVGTAEKRSKGEHRIMKKKKTDAVNRRPTVCSKCEYPKPIFLPPFIPSHRVLGLSICRIVLRALFLILSHVGTFVLFQKRVVPVRLYDTARGHRTSL